jgi:hypothetical protein
MDIEDTVPRGEDRGDPIEPVRSASTTATQSKPTSILQPIDMEEAPPVRTKLKLLAILIALYVRSSRSSISLLLIARPALLIPRSPRPNHHGHGHPNHRRITPQQQWLLLDRRRLSPRHRRRRSHRCQTLGHMGPQTSLARRSRALRWGKHPRCIGV